jgi:hypothetical protein
MATTGELRAIIEALELVDIGDAASYLGEEEVVVSDSLMFAQAVGLTVPLTIDTSNGAGTNSSSAQ